MHDSLHADSVTVLLSALTGGLAGSIFALLSQSFLSWIRKPVLQVSFSATSPGCDVSTTTNIDNLHQHYLRLKIENVGRTFARNVSASMTALVHISATSTKEDREFAEEVLDMKWSLIGGTRSDIPSRGHRFVDVIHARKFRSDPASGTSIEFDFHPTPIRLPELGWRRGRYSATIFVAAENAASISKKISWSWDETFEGLRIL